ncbi:MAG: molybdopterin-dependent oxidoreductase [Nitrospinae bacterium]|nr:molybdopterin-dependent oxidoreductase [Nitrospinota bacterium]
MALSRRRFLTLMGAAAPALAGAAALAGAEQKAPEGEAAAPAFLDYPYTEKLIQRQEDDPGLPDAVVNTGCSFCPSNCRHSVHLKKGRVFNVYGEPADPVQRGKLCAKGQAIPQLLYNKYRITKPMKRVGPKPSDQFEPISWAQAYQEIAAKLLEIRDNGGGAKMVAAKASGRQTRESGAMQWRFMELLGSPNTTHEGYICNDAGGIALKMTFGHGGQTNGYGPDPISGTNDLGDSKFILWFGTNDAENHPVVHGYLKLAKEKTGAEWVVVDPRMTPTGMGANLWIPIKPGTDMALAYGMLSHIIDNGLYDAGFVSQWVTGFDELRRHISAKGYTPKWAETVTGIPADVIRRVATKYATTKPAAIMTNAGIAHQVNAVATFRVLTFLAAITGNIGKPGAGANFMHNSPIGVSLPPIKNKQPITEAGLPPQPDYFTEAILTGKPYGLKAVIYAGNMMTQNANSKRVGEALSKLELFVSLNLFPQEDTFYADYILPTTTFYEVDHVGVRRLDRGIRWRNKVVDPVGESKVDSLIWIELAQEMAKQDKKNPPEYWKDNLKLEWANTRDLWNKVSPANNKTAAGMTADRMDKLASPLRWPCPSADHPGTSVMYLDHPKWRDIFGGKRFLTPSGKVEIYTGELQAKLAPTGHSALPVFYTSPENLEGLPTVKYLDEFVKSPTVSNTEGGNLVHKIEIVEKPEQDMREKYPFQLTTGRPNALHFHSITHWAWGLVQAAGDRYVQIHPLLAQQIGVQTGDIVKVDTARGSIDGPALVWDGIEPNTVFIPQSFGPKQVLRKELDRKAWEPVNNLTGGFYDTLSGQVAYKAQACSVSSQPGRKIYPIGHPLEELQAGEGKKG